VGREKDREERRETARDEGRKGEGGGLLPKLNLWSHVYILCDSAISQSWMQQNKPVFIA